MGNTGLIYGENKILRLPYETKEHSEKRNAEWGDVPYRSIPQLLLRCVGHRSSSSSSSSTAS